MTDLMVDCITSLDGFGAAHGWPGLWGMGSPDYLAWLEEDSQTEYVTLMGANTYRMFDEFAAAGEPGVEELARRRTLVFSRTMEDPPSWPRTTLVSDDAVDAVRSLKEQSQLPLRILGSLSLSRSLLAAGLVDRYRVVVFPVVNGATGYDRIYDGWPDVRMELVSSRTFDGGLQLLEYVPTILDRPPGSS